VTQHTTPFFLIISNTVTLTRTVLHSAQQILFTTLRADKYLTSNPRCASSMLVVLLGKLFYYDTAACFGLNILRRLYHNTTGSPILRSRFLYFFVVNAIMFLYVVSESPPTSPICVISVILRLVDIIHLYVPASSCVMQVVAPKVCYNF